MARKPSQKVLSKKHKARLQQEQQNKKLLIITTAVVFVAVVVVIIFGVLDQTVLKMQKPVAKVDNVRIKSDEFIRMVKLERQQMNAQAYQYETYKQFFAYDQTNTAYFDSLISQIQSQMDVPETVGSTVLTNMINSQVIEFYAKDNGIDVTDEEIQTAIKDDFGFYPNGTPTPSNTSTPYSTPTLSATQYALVTATPTQGPTDVVTPTATLETTTEATSTIDAQAPTEVPTTAVEPTAETTPTVVPTPTVYTEALFQDNYNGFVTRFADIGFTEQDILDLYRVQMISQKVYEQITADVPTEEEQIWARHILVATEEEAQSVLDRLANGEDWTTLAAEVSTDTSNNTTGGDLGWFGHNQMVAEFETAAYALQIGEISQPVQTTYGYHIIQLLGREVRPLDSSTLDQNKQTVFNDWLTAQKATHTIEQYDDVWMSIVPDTPAFGDY